MDDMNKKEAFKYHMKQTYIWKMIEFFRIRIWIIKKLYQGANLVCYWWSWDGEIELCERMDVVIDEEKECYHCLAVHKPENRMAKLYSVKDNLTYHMCIRCADENTSRYKPEDYNWWESSW